MNLLTPFRRALMPTPSVLFDQWLRNAVGDNGRGIATAEAPLLPRADVAETDTDYLVTLELPGIEPADVDVRMVGDELVVTGQRKQRREEKNERVVLTERLFGAFERRFELPSDVSRDADAVKATFGKGLLELRLHKAKTASTKIPVKTV